MHRFTPDVVDFALTVIDAGSAVDGITLETGGLAIVRCLHGELMLQGELVLERGRAAYCDEPTLRVEGLGRGVVATGAHPQLVDA